MKIDQRTALQIFDYDSQTGVFKWRISASAKANSRSVAGTLRADGYRYIGYKGVNYSAHRLAWLMAYGEFPVGAIDHIDGNRDNNALSNLRLADPEQNSRNTAVRRKGLKGAYRSGNTWFSVIRTGDNSKVYLGSFSSEKEAHEAYVTASQKFHGSFGRAF
jgi:hypothetical protein